MDLRGRLRVGDGSPTLPSLAFRLDGNTGLYRPGANELAITCGGAEKWRIDDQGRISQDGGTTWTNRATAFTPALTASTLNPTLGSGSVQSGRYISDGGWVKGWGYIQYGTSGVANGTGNYSVSLPVTPPASQPANHPIGAAIMRRASDGLLIKAALLHPGGAVATSLMLSDVAAANAAIITDTSPFASVASTAFMYTFGYAL